MIRRLLQAIALTLLASAASLAQDYTTTPNLGLRKPNVGSTNWSTYVNQDFDTLDSAVGVFKGGFTTVPFSSTPQFDMTKGNTFQITLLSNVTSSTVNQPRIQPGQLLYLIVCQNSTGGFAFTFPSSFQTPLPTITSTASKCSDTTWQWNGSVWISAGGGTGGGGGTTLPSAPAFSVQIANANVTAFSASSISDNGSVVAIGEPLNANANASFKGPNPYTDVTLYGVRSVNTSIAPAVPGVTASISAGSAAASISTPSTFHPGDGVDVFNAGSACPLTSPTGLTVTPSIAAGPTGTGFVANAPSGSTTYNYQIVAVDKLGCVTAASTVATTTTGSASLGSQSFTISGFTRSGNVVTATTTAPHGLVTNTEVVITTPSSLDAGSFGGTYIVSSTPLSTTFTYQTGLDVADGAPTTSAGGGTVFYFNANHLTWTPVAGADKYFIYGRTGGSLTQVGASLPNNPSQSITVSSWDDFGATMMASQTFPFWLPTTPPGSALPDMLVTTICGGAGTTSLTLCSTANTTVVNATILLDSAPGIQAAKAASGGMLYFPGGSYVVNSHTIVPNMFAELAGANLVLNDTLEAASPRLFGMIGPQAQDGTAFGWPTGGLISVGHTPVGLWDTAGQSSFYEGIRIAGSANAQVPMLVDGGLPAAFEQSHWKNVNFVDGGGAADYMGIQLYVRGGFWYDFDHVLFASGPGTFGGGFVGSTTTPGALFNQSGGLTFNQISVQDRGIVKILGATGNVVSDRVTGNSRAQGIITPFYAYVQTANGVGGRLDLGGIELDTTGEPWFAALSGPNGGLGAYTVNLASVGSFPCCGYGLTTGNPIFNLIGAGDQNFSTIVDYNFTNNPVNVTGIGEFMVPIINTTAPTLAVSSGGNEPIGTVCFQLSMIDVNANEGTLGPFACATTTTGNQTVTVTAPAAPAGAIGWLSYRGGAGGAGADRTAEDCFVTGIPYRVSQVMTIGNGCGKPPSNKNRAGSQSVSAAGLSGTVINVLGSGFKDAISGTFTANRTQTLQDVTDTFVYRNSTDTLQSKTLSSPVINGTVSGTALQGTDTKLLSSGTVSGTGVALCTDANGGATTSGCATSASFYQTMLANATAQTQEPKLNFINGTNMTITCADNAGSTRTDCTFTASNTGATAFSAITAATNSNAGSFVMSGNTLDLTGATFLLAGATMNNIVAPSTPASGKNTLYSDSTDLRLHDKNASGTIGTTVVANAGSAHNFVTSLSTAGVLSTAQPAFTDISGVMTTAQQPTSTVNAVTNDTNVTGSIAGQTLTLGWTGTLSKARSLATVVYTDQTNAFSNLQDFSAASLKIPIGAGLAPTTSGLEGYDSTANAYKFGVNGVTHTVAFLDSSITGNAATATALAAAGTTCTSGQPALGVDVHGNAVGCAALTAAQVTNAFDRSANNTLGAHYFDMTVLAAPGNPLANNGRLYIDSSTNQLTCLLSNGTSCFPLSSGNANAALSNLAGVAINTSLLPGADNSINLGSPSLRWANIYFAGSLVGSGTGPVTLQGNTGSCVGATSLGTLCFSSTGNRPTYDFNLGGFNNLVLSGVDINTSDQVTVTHLAAPLPVAQGGTAVTDLSFSGSTHKACTTSGTLTSGNVVKFDASGNCVDGANVAANLVTNAANFTAGNVVSAAGAHTTQDSGIAATNLFTTSSKTDVLQAGAFCADAGASGTTYSCSLTPAITAYVTGTSYRVKFNTANTGAATVNLNALGAKTIKKPVGGITTDIVANDIQAGQWATLVYDGTNMQITTLLGNAPGSGTVTTTGSPASGNLAKFSSGSAITNGDLSGDATTSGTLAVTVAKINGTAFSGTNGDVVSFGAANTPADSGFLATNVVRKDAANTGAAAMTLDMSASTSAAAFRVPNIAGASSTTNGVFSYDTTNLMLHAGSNSVDNILGTFPSTLTPTDGDCVIWKKATNTFTLDDRGACPAGGSGNTTSTSLVTNNLPVANGATSLIDSGIVAANVTTNSTNYVNGNVIAATGNHTANDSGVASANLVTAAANYTNGDLVQAAGANKTTSDSGVVAANVVTATSAAASAKQICTSGGATKTCAYIDYPDVKVIPAANCNNTSAGAAWSIGSGGTASCRAGTNNLGGFVSITDTSSTFATFQVVIPEDWDTGTNPYIRFQLASTDATNAHTVIPSIQVACYKGDGSTTDDVAANAAHSLSTVTLNGNANRFWSTANVQMNSTDMTGCVAGALMQVTVGRATDTATNAEFYSATITFPRLLVVQAN